MVLPCSLTEANSMPYPACHAPGVHALQAYFSPLLETLVRHTPTGPEDLAMEVLQHPLTLPWVMEPWGRKLRGTTEHMWHHSLIGSSLSCIRSQSHMGPRGRASSNPDPTPSPSGTRFGDPRCVPSTVLAVPRVLVVTRWGRPYLNPEPRRPCQTMGKLDLAGDGIASYEA